MDLEFKGGSIISDANDNKNNENSSSASTINEISTMKRSSSAPTGLNYVGLESLLHPPSTSNNSNSSPANDTRIALPAAIYRRNSSVCHSVRTPESMKKVARRLHCLRHESDLRNCIETDYAGERFFRSAAQISNGWNDFQIDDSPSPIQSTEERKRAKSVCEPVHIFTNFLPASCSPSPTRNEKQCYSPSMQQVVRKACFSPSPSPSPTRRSFLRSLSPIAVRQQIGLKRKYDSDSENNSLCVSAKRITYTPPVPMQVDHEPSSKVLPISNIILNHSLSVSSLDSESSSNSTICSDFTTTSERSMFSLSAPAMSVGLFDSCMEQSSNTQCVTVSTNKIKPATSSTLDDS